MVTIYKNKDVMEEYYAPVCRVFSVEVEKCIAQIQSPYTIPDDEYDDVEGDY